MSSEGVPAYYKLRILDPLSTNEVVHDLPHLHQGSVTVEGYQAGTKMLGSFRFPLFPPKSEQYDAYKVMYDLLDENQRIEIYTGDVIAGQPFFTGTIRRISRNRDNFEISGYDSVINLDRQQVFPGESVNGTTYDVANQYLGRNLMSFGDDFSSGSLASYTQLAGAWSTGSDAKYGTYVTTGALPNPADVYMRTNSTWTNAVYQPLSVAKGIFEITGATTSVQAGVFVNFTAGNGDSFLLGEASLNSSGSVDALIYTRDSGVYNQRASATNIFPNITVNGTVLVEVELISYYTVLNGVNTNLISHLLINGKDTCQYTFGNPAGISGNVGLRFGGAGTGGSVKCYELTFKTRAAVGHQTPLAFQQGSSLSGATASVNTVNQVWSGQTFLDILHLCAATEGFILRKTSKAGVNQDLMDMAAAPGTDFSKTYIFREGDNLVDVQQDSNAETFATSTRFTSAAGANTNGAVSFDNITAINKYGIWDDTAQDLGAADVSVARGLAKRLTNLRATPFQAKTVTIVRDPLWAANFDAGNVREQDAITIHSPLYGLNYQKVTILGFTLTEGEPTMQLVCDQYPMRPVLEMRRAIRNLEYAGNLFANR